MKRALDLAQIGEHMVAAACRTVQPVGVSLWLPSRTGSIATRTSPQPPAVPRQRS